jgi:formylglycine-generating enzyme required for sulfatase activity
MVRIPAGTFQMGSPDTERGRYVDWDCEGPVHQVTIAYDYYMGETEVTQAQWEALMETNPATDSYEAHYFGSWGVGNDYPVYYVSWDDITHTNGFLERLDAHSSYNGFRLPTEAEWEYACRAGTTTRFYFGDSLGCLDMCQDCAAGTLPGNRSDYMRYCGNYTQYGSKPVLGKLPNEFGLYDMHGSLWEWCEDYWHYNYNGAPTNGSPWSTPVDSRYGDRVIRGGACNYNARDCRSAARSWYYEGHEYFHIGLRVVLPVSP